MVCRIPAATVWKVVLMKRDNPTMPTSRIASECSVSAHTVRNIVRRIQQNAEDPLPPRNQSRPGARKISHDQQQVLVECTKRHGRRGDLGIRALASADKVAGQSHLIQDLPK